MERRREGIDDGSKGMNITVEERGWKKKEEEGKEGMAGGS